MPILKSGEARIHYALEGQSGTSVLLFSNSLGANYSMWDPQVPELRKKLRVLRYDTRGHGQSSLTPGLYSIEQLGKDVIVLLDALDLDRVHFCGLSMGGMIGMWLGVNAPERLNKLVLCNTAARIGTPETWNVFARIPREGSSDGIKYSENARGSKPGGLCGLLRRRSRFRFPRTIEQDSRANPGDHRSARSGYAACGRTLSRTSDSRRAIC